MVYSGCFAHPKKTVCEIVKSGNHYCIGLKANQPKLLQQAQQCAQSQVPLSCYQALDTSHGRVVERRVRVFAAPSELSRDWAGLAAFVAVERSGIRQGHAFGRHSWFIISQVIEAQQLASMIQAHRGTTENKLHWVMRCGARRRCFLDSITQTCDSHGFIAFLGNLVVS